MDLVGNRSLSGCKRVLKDGGRHVPSSGGRGDWLGPIPRIIGGLLVFLFGGKRFKMFMPSLDAADLVVISEFIEAGQQSRLDVALSCGPADPKADPRREQETTL